MKFSLKNKWVLITGASSGFGAAAAIAFGAEGANGVTNEGELCLKGRYGWDFLNDTKLLTPRLKKPLLRRHRGESPVRRENKLHDRRRRRHAADQQLKQVAVVERG